MIVIMLVSTGLGIIASDNAQAAFIEQMVTTGLPSTFVAFDTAWNEAGTMAVVVGFDSSGTPGTNAYAFYPHNNSYWPIDNDNWNQQKLQAVDYFSEPVYDWPNVLLVDADWVEDGLINFYTDVFNLSQAYYDVWDVWDAPSIDQGKPTASDMAEYDLVVWIPSRYMEGQFAWGEPLNNADIQEIMIYLNGGGNFFLSNLAFSGHVPWGYGTFLYNYLGVDSLDDMEPYEYGTRPVSGDPVFGNLWEESMNWNSYGWAGRDAETDAFYSGIGTFCFQCRDFGGAIWQNTGVRYDSGVFKTIFFGFPIETLPLNYASELMQLALEWYCPEAIEGLDQKNENIGSGSWIDPGMSIDSPFAQAFVPDNDWISSVEFFMYTDMGSTDYFDVHIYPDNGMNEPDTMGMHVTSGFIYPENMPKNYANSDWVKCLFADGGAPVNPGNKYWIVCYRYGFTWAQNWRIDDSSSYTKGDVKSWNGGSWDTEFFDFVFRTYSQRPSGDGIIDQSNEYMGASQWNYVMNHDSWAQSFKPSAGIITAVEFFMYSEGMSDYFSIEIRENNGGWPSGATLAMGYIYQTNIPQSLAASNWVRCTLDSPATLVIGNTYWIVCTQYDKSYNQNWLHDESRSYLDGVAMRYSMGSWAYENYYDWIFRTITPSGGSGGSNSVTLTLNPFKDNTMYSENFQMSNGVGEQLVAGRTWEGWNRRPLLEFDIATSIPKYSKIKSASLELYCTYDSSLTSSLVQIYNVQSEWGEAGSDAGGNEVYGTNAQIGDATWEYRYYDSQTWQYTYGGDPTFMVAEQWVGIDYEWYTWSTSDMVMLVQNWLNEPASNHGLLLMGDEATLNRVKSFASKDNPNANLRPKLTITYTPPTVIGHHDVFWIAGDTYGPTPPATAYKLIPSQGLELIPMNYFSTVQLYRVAIDDTGCPLFAGRGTNYLHYYDGNGWIQMESNVGLLNSYWFYGLDFNPNDRRFYITGPDYAFYTDAAPLSPGSRCYRFNHFPDLSGSLDCQLAWNNLYNYGLVGGDTYLVKIWPFGTYGNGTAKYQIINSNSQNHYYDISWDTDGWNEAGFAGNKGGKATYWRYYHTNPQVLDGYSSLTGSAYYTCAFKPPSSPKWLFIPSGLGSIRVNTEEKDQSGEITVSSDFPHIFGIAMWKQSDNTHLDTWNTQVEADSTYTFAFEGNYTRNGIDHWDDLELWLTGWFDYGFTGTNSQPGDTTWSLDNYRTSQFNLTYDVSSGTVALFYPVPLFPAGEELSIHSSWEDPASYGADGFSHRLYINLTFGPQTTMANGALTPATGGFIWDRNFALNNQWTWDLRFWLYDSFSPTARNITYDEFGMQRYASVSTTGNPSGSIPPGAMAPLSEPTVITYSTNAQYKLNVSIPNLLKDGDPSKYISVGYVRVWNDHSNANAGNSNISNPAYTQFNGPNQNQLIWGTSGTWIQPVGSGTVSSGPMYSDYTAALVPQTFEVTEVYWVVEVPVGTPEGVYRATVTITLWS
jgi:hypothetical protein